MATKPLFLALALAAAAATAAQAHPHVWVTGTTTLKFQGQKLSSVAMRWQFDAFFSQVLLGDYDKNKDGTLDAAETAAMKEQVFTSLREYGYFTHMAVNGADTKFARVDDFSTQNDKGELVFLFDLIPPAPLDLSKSDALLSLFDPTIYVDIVLAGDTPVTIEGAGAEKCRANFAKGDEIANETGFVTAQVVRISCKT